MPLTIANYSIIHTVPTLIFEVDNWLDSERFDALAKSIPSLSDASERDNGKFVFDRSSTGFSEFLTTNANWRQFLHELSQPDFLSECNDIYNQYIGRHEHWTRSGSFTADVKNRRILGRDLVDVTMEFSIMQNGAFIVPHTDNPRKLMTLMLYFPSSKGESIKKNGTKFWRFDPNVAEKYSNFANEKHDSTGYADFFSDAECFYQTNFEANHLYGFLKTDMSWHSVENVKLPTGQSRNSINININRAGYKRGS